MISLESFFGVTFINLVIVFVWTFFASFGTPGAAIFASSVGAFSNNLSELSLLIIVFFLATVIGDICVYEMSRRISNPILKKLRKFKFFRVNEVFARRYINKYGAYSVFFTRFALIWLGAILNYISGFERLNRKKFIIAVLFGEIIYAIFYPIMGFIFREAWIELAEVIQETFIVILIFLIFLWLIIIIKRRMVKSPIENYIVSKVKRV